MVARNGMKSVVGARLGVRVALTKTTARVGCGAAEGRWPEGPSKLSPRFSCHGGRVRFKNHVLEMASQ